MKLDLGKKGYVRRYDLRVSLGDSMWNGLWFRTGFRMGFNLRFSLWGDLRINLVGSLRDSQGRSLWFTEER